MGGPMKPDRWVLGALGVNPALFANASGQAAAPAPGAAATVTRKEAEAALAKYLARAQAAQGGTSLRMTPKVRDAIAEIARNDQQLSLTLAAGIDGPDIAGDAAHVAAAIAKLLPETLPKESIAHLATAAVDSAKPKPGFIDGKLQMVKDKLNTVTSPDHEQDGRGSPYHNEPPPAAPPDPNAPTTISTPPSDLNLQKDRPAPKPAPPDAPSAAEGKAIAAAIAGIDDASLVPASARGKPAAGNYPQAKVVAAALANDMETARAAGQDRADFRLAVPYPTSEDTKAAADSMDAIVHAIAKALPDAGAPLSLVVIALSPPTGHHGGGWEKRVSLRE